MPVIIFGRFMELVKSMPEQTRRRVMTRNVSYNPMDGRVEYRICRSRESMARQIRKEEQRPPHTKAWRPLVKLDVLEGYK